MECSKHEWGFNRVYPLLIDVYKRQVLDYYRTRFQLEFCFRDGKQHAGITNCQSTDFRKLDDFHAGFGIANSHVTTGTKLTHQFSDNGFDLVYVDGRFFIFTQHGAGTVSYTHLDVYKRQSYISANGSKWVSVDTVEKSNLCIKAFSDNR